MPPGSSAPPSRRWVIQSRTFKIGSGWGPWETIGERVFTLSSDDPVNEDMQPRRRAECLASLQRHLRDDVAIQWRLLDPDRRETEAVETP
jgi:hypothetical protein